MKFHADCVPCLISGALKRLDPRLDEGKRLEFLRGVCGIIADTDPEHDASPLVDARIIALKRDLLGVEDDYTQVKHSFNGLMLSLYPQLRAQVEAAEDPLRMAIQLSMAGNYIDFGVLGNVEAEDALRMLEQAAEKQVDETEYALLKQDLEREGELVFLHDNCGEVVLDKLLLETIHALYPCKRLVSVVRGGPVLNDATIDDAREAGLAEVAEVVENGLKDIAGTQLDMLPEDVRLRLERAGMIIAKGQGNFETLTGCGLNVYYLFLSKCASYTQWFGFERFSGILKNDLRM